MLRKVVLFLVYESVGVALMWLACLLPRQHGPEIPVVLFVVGIMSCFTGLGHGFSLVPRTRALSFHHWTGRVTPPTSGKEVAVWAVTGAVRTQRGPGGGEAGGGANH
jgi:hypothetical protein